MRTLQRQPRKRCIHRSPPEPWQRMMMPHEIIIYVQERKFSARSQTYATRNHREITAMGIDASHDLGVERDGRASDFRLLVLKTNWKPMSVVLEQFVSLTSGTSLGSAKVMSTHCNVLVRDSTASSH